MARLPGSVLLLFFLLLSNGHEVDSDPNGNLSSRKHTAHTQSPARDENEIERDVQTLIDSEVLISLLAGGRTRSRDSTG
ncbi:MAG: hypothetical protein P4M11_09315 [Candidatus Pacebacteria bacterium]|nr:hypothetical protein [Candidatus Paceibacterota bacterium]